MKRQPGYYWAQPYKGKWEVCLWKDESWYIISAGKYTQDSDIMWEVNEMRIMAPDESIRLNYGCGDKPISWSVVDDMEIIPEADRAGHYKSMVEKVDRYIDEIGKLRNNGGGI